MRAPPLVINFLKFGGLSGLGWIVDTCILLSLLRMFDMVPFAANLISSGVVALAIFLISREVVFRKAAGRIGLRVAFYLVYTTTVICIASVGVQAIAAWLGVFAAANGFVLPRVAVALGAKVLVTPPQLILNFVVSRLLSERDMKTGGAVQG